MYALRTWVTEQIEAIPDPPAIDLTPYATKAWVTEQIEDENISILASKVWVRDYVASELKDPLGVGSKFVLKSVYNLKLIEIESRLDEIREAAAGESERLTGLVAQSG